MQIAIKLCLKCAKSCYFAVRGGTENYFLVYSVKPRLNRVIILITTFFKASAHCSLAQLVLVTVEEKDQQRGLHSSLY